MDDKKSQRPLLGFSAVRLTGDIFLLGAFFKRADYSHPLLNMLELFTYMLPAIMIF